jgi:membrane-associated PAP2 superfamily phosphatase
MMACPILFNYLHNLWFENRLVDISMLGSSSGVESPQCYPIGHARDQFVILCQSDVFRDESITT